MTIIDLFIWFFIGCVILGFIWGLFSGLLGFLFDLLLKKPLWFIGGLSLASIVLINEAIRQGFLLILAGLAAIVVGKPDVPTEPFPFPNESTEEQADNKSDSDKPELKIGDKIRDQARKRGWTEEEIRDTVEDPHSTEKTRDTRNKEDGTREDSPATGYIDEDGHYVIVNDETGDVVQISDKNNPDWAAPWE